MRFSATTWALGPAFALTLLCHAAGVGTIEVHQGFYQGAKRQLPEIQRVVAAHASDGGRRLPVRRLSCNCSQCHTLPCRNQFIHLLLFEGLGGRKLMTTGILEVSVCQH